MCPLGLSLVRDLGAKIEKLVTICVLICVHVKETIVDGITQ